MRHNRTMKNKNLNGIFLIFMTLIFFSSCVLSQEDRNYQKRVSAYYETLNSEELELFQEGKLNELGASHRESLQNNEQIQKKYQKVKEYEAIMAFPPEETAHFFRFYILRELNRHQYLRFMEKLSAEEQLLFAESTDDLISRMSSVWNKQSKWKKFFDHCRHTYKLKEFTNSEIALFYREVLFTEITRKELYHVLEILNQAGVLKELLLEGSLKTAQDKFIRQLESQISLQYEFDNVQRKTSLSKLSPEDFIRIYDQVIMKEMDPEALNKTVHKFLN